MTAAEDILDRAAAAALALAGAESWRSITLRKIADTAGLGFADLYAAASTKHALLAHLSRRFDHAALSAPAVDGDVKERLFEAVMARLEAMEPHRAALLAIGETEGPLVLGAHLPATARACLEASGVEATVPRLAALAAVLARIHQVWRADGPDLSRSMAELDNRLGQMLDLLKRAGVGV